MPLNLSIGVTEKLGQPNYGSIGASCHIECELDSRLLFDQEEFQNQVREIYASCAEAVREELARRQVPQNHNGVDVPNGVRPATNGGSHDEPAPRNGDCHASVRQLDYLQQLCRQIPNVGIRKLDSLAERLCGKPVPELTSLDASSLIDTLRALKEGRLELVAVLSEENA